MSFCPTTIAMPEFGDAHLHLLDPVFSTDLHEVLERARKRGVRRFVVNAAAEEEWEDLIGLCKGLPDGPAPNNPRTPKQGIQGGIDGAEAFLGLHPWNIGKASEGWEQRLEHLALHDPRVSGLGETGLDRLFCPETMEAQMKALEFHLDLSSRSGLPVCVHCLKAWEELYHLLAPRFRGRVVPPPVMVHGFSGSAETAEMFASMGCFISVGGAILSRGIRKVKAILEAIPKDLILVESDAPDMLPPIEILSFQPEKMFLGADGSNSEHEAVPKNTEQSAPVRLRNEPAAAADAAKVFAGMLGIPFGQFLSISASNLDRFLTRRVPGNPG